MIPAFNEAGRLPARLVELYTVVASNPEWEPVEVLVVDDGSSDRTLTIAERVKRPANIMLRMLRHPRNRGKGAAVRTGFAASRGELVLLSDADHSTPFDEMKQLARQLSEGTVVIGSRAVDRSLILTRQPWYRDLMGRTFNLLVQALLLPGLKDTQCGFKLFQGPLARALAARQRIDGFAYDVELLSMARVWGWDVVEIPVRWAHAEASRVSPVRHSVEMLAEVIGLRWRRFPDPPPGLEPGPPPRWLAQISGGGP